MRAVVIVPVLKQARGRGQKPDAVPTTTRTPEKRLEEAKGLARAIDLEVVHGAVVSVAEPRPASPTDTLEGANIYIAYSRFSEAAGSLRRALDAAGFPDEPVAPSEPMR